MSPEEDVEYSQWPRARQPAMDRKEIFPLDEDNDEEVEREDNPACGDYSRKYLEIVARHKEMPWKSDTTRVGWNSKDARSTKGNAYTATSVCSLSSLMVRATSSPILCSSKLLHPEKVGRLNYIVDGNARSVLKNLKDEDISYEDAFIGALWDKELTIRAMERETKSLKKAFKIAERMELYAKKVKPEGKDGFESKLKYLVKPGNLFQVYCAFVTLNQDCCQLQAFNN